MSEIKPVFLFRILDSEGNGDSRYVVNTVTHWDWTSYDSSWMCNPTLGRECLVLDVDLIDEEWIFVTEQEALAKVAELYAQQWVNPL